MRYYFIFTLSLLFLINCKTTRKETALLDTYNYTQKELQSKYYKYENIGTLSKQNDKKSTSFQPIIYTNIEGSPKNKKYPRSIFYPSMEEKNYDYFIDELDGQYVLYLEKDGKIIMREYGNYFSMNKLRDTDSLKWETSKMNSEQKIYDYLKNNNIKYKFISKKNDGIENIIKIQLIPSKYYTYIRFCGNYIVSNMYYQPQDTLPSSSYNKLGYLLLR